MMTKNELDFFSKEILKDGKEIIELNKKILSIYERFRQVEERVSELENQKRSNAQQIEDYQLDPTMYELAKEGKK